MSTIQISRANVFSGLSLRGLLRPIIGPEREAEDTSAEAERSRRTFVNDMLSRNPDAFASELDVQGMMHLFPGRF